MCLQSSSQNAYSTAKISRDQFGPIHITYSPKNENISYFQLVDSDNKILNKTIIVFTHLCTSVHSLVEKSHELVQRFLFYDEDLSIAGDKGAEGYGNIVKISEILKFLYEIKYFINNCVTVTINITKQMGGLFETEKSYFNLQTSIHYQSVFHCFADIIHIFVIFDEILLNSNIYHNWSTYKKLVKSVEHNIEKFGKKYDKTSLIGLQSILKELETIFSGRLLQVHIIFLYKILK